MVEAIIRKACEGGEVRHVWNKKTEHLQPGTKTQKQPFREALPLKSHHLSTLGIKLPTHEPLGDKPLSKHSAPPCCIFAMSQNIQGNNRCQGSLRMADASATMVWSEVSREWRGVKFVPPPALPTWMGRERQRTNDYLKFSPAMHWHSSLLHVQHPNPEASARTLVLGRAANCTYSYFVLNSYSK